MFENHTHRILLVLLCMILLVTACASPAQDDSVIATAVAQTVQAQATDIPPLATSTPDPALLLQPTLTQAFTPTSEATLISAPSDPNCIHANLVGEYPPDATIYRPGDSFTKTWTIRNDGTCTWDSSYKLVYWSGDIMGGSTSYPLPEAVPPGDDIPITILLQAPPSEGTYTGYWRLQTPWNAVFGVGQYSQAFYANIVVFSRPGPRYGITNVSYEVTRDPLSGCPVNVRWTVHVTVTTNGPYEFMYYIDQSDGNESAVKTMVFAEAGSKTVSREWMIGRSATSNPRWMEFVETIPEAQYYKYYGRVFIYKDCA